MRKHPKKAASGRRKPWIVRAANAAGWTPSPGVESALGWVQALAVAGTLAWVVLTFVLVRMTVPTGSMSPTIAVGTSFFVDKLSFHFRDPTPGQIIVFWRTQPDGRRERLVKRLIGTGGQQVEIRDCDQFDENICGVYVDGARLSGPAFDRPYYTVGGLPTQQWQVPAGHYFVLGDNARISEDSRYWGFAARADVIGEPFLRVWPPEQFGFMNGYFGSAP